MVTDLVRRQAKPKSINQLPMVVVVVVMGTSQVRYRLSFGWLGLSWGKELLVVCMDQRPNVPPQHSFDCVRYGTGPDRLGGMGTNWAVGQPAGN